MTVPESVVVEVYRMGNAYTVTIMQENANGSGHGYRIAGPKLLDRGERVARHKLSKRDAEQITHYCEQVDA